MPNQAEGKDRHGRGFIIGVFVGAFLFGLFSFFIAQAFNGPTSAPGVGNGAIGVGSTTNDVSVGTSSPSQSVKLLVVGSTTDTTAYALQLLQSSGGPLLYVRNDGGLSVATTSVTAGTVTIQGNLTVSGSITGGSEATAISANNITGGTFSSNESLANFAFPESLGINTSTGVSLPQALSVYGGGFFTGVGLFNGNVGGANLYASSSLAYLGNGAGGSIIDASDTAIGSQALGSLLNGNYNTAVGAGALAAVGNGLNNVALGYEAGYSDSGGSKDVFLGNLAGLNETTSNKLYIADASASTLIYGDFSNGWVGINTTTPGQALAVQGGAFVSGNITSTNLTVGALGSSGSPCVDVNGSGVLATTTCGGGGLSGGQANFIPLWTSPSALGTSTLEQNGTTTYTMNGLAIGTSTLQSAGNLYVNGGVTTGGSVTVGSLSNGASAASGYNCVDIGILGVLASTTCGVPIGNGANNWIPLWSSSSTQATSTLQQNGTTTYTTDGFAIGTSTIQSPGNLFITGNYLGGTLSAGLVSSNAFGAGNYAFTSNLNVGTSSTVGASTLSVYGNLLVTGTDSTTQMNASGINVNGFATSTNLNVTATSTVRNILTVSGRLFTQTSTLTDTNSNATTSFLTTGVGTTSIPVNVFSVGTVIQIMADGQWGTTTTAPTGELNVSLGTGNFNNGSGATMVGGFSGKAWHLQCDIMIVSLVGGTSGTADTTCTMNGVTTSASSVMQLAINNQTSTFSLAGAAPVINWQFLFNTANAANTITSTISYVNVFP